ncbi:NUDIX domain-containing protein [Brevirhabdus sp.]|uniref:NUDIX domain-containing protein n=1 Tax=Brevirhabdus sp. TaxID=2004514 RepID=UPI0040594166
MIRRFGHPPQTGRRYRARPGVYAVLHREGSLLLTWQGTPHHEFQLPGGGIDPGEHPLPALHREVMEETGYRMQVRRRLGAFRRYTYMPEYRIWAEKLCHVYLCRPTLRLGPPGEVNHTAVWMPLPKAVRALSVEGDRYFASLI